MSRRCPSVLLAVLGVLAAAPVAFAGPWRPPVPGEVVRVFAPGVTPYDAGAHRGVDLAARPGAPVRAACAGVVRFAGRTPRGPAVTVRCGRLDATHLGLAALRVRAGAHVARGTPLGVVAARGEDGGRPHVHLGARRGRRYVDPLALMERAPMPPPPLAPHPRRRRPPAAVPPRPLPAAAPVAPGRAPLLAWAGAALLALGVPAGLLRRRARRRGAIRPSIAFGAPWPSTSPPRSTTSTPRRTSATRTR
jgi:murein DD-endopeptidase MepM/ murein hydrolase activator NlpD